MFEMSGTSHELNESLPDNHDGNSSFQAGTENTEVTPLAPMAESALTHRPETYEPRAYTESRELPADQAEAAGEPTLERPVHVTILSADGAPLSQEAVQNYMTGRSVRLPRQSSLFEDERWQIDDTRTGFKDIALGAGVDIQGNAPSLDDRDYTSYHPYPVAAMLHDDMNTYDIPLLPDAQALQQFEIGVAYSQDSPQWRQNLVRMTVRDMSRQVAVEIDPRGDLTDGMLLDVQGISSTVCEDGRPVVKGRVLNDLAVDVVAIRLGSAYQQDSAPYSHNDLVAAAVIDEVVRRQHIDPDEMENVLVRGLVADDHALEEAIKDSFGSEGLKMVMRLGDKNALQVERELDLAAAVSRIRAYADNPDRRYMTHTGFYPWLRWH